MNDIERKSLRLLADVLHGRAPETLSADEWPEIDKVLRAQTVEGLIAGQINAIGLSNEDKLRYMQGLGMSYRWFSAVMEEQNKLQKVLNEANIPFVVLKGAAAAQYYPNPSQRAMGDIDFIVPKGRFEEAYRVLIEAGYTSEEDPTDYERHIGFTSDSQVHLELHEHFSSSKNEEQNTILDGYIYAGIDKREQVDVKGYMSPVLPWLENGLVLIGHVNQHLGSGLGLRQIVDWMCYAEKELISADKVKAFLNAADRIGMRKLAIVVTEMCKKHLGMSDDVLSGISSGEAELSDMLMEYVLSKGNFGRNDSEQSRTVQIAREFRNPIKGLKFAQQLGCDNWDACKKHSWLKTFAWFYQICRWIHQGVKRGMNVSDALKYSGEEKGETELLKRLGVTRL